MSDERRRSESEQGRAVSPEDVRQIAKLSRLRLDEPTLVQLTDELNGILEHVRVLESLDPSPLDDTTTVPDELARFRDPATPPDELGRRAAQDLAPDWREGFFVVPRLPALDAESDHEDGGGP